MYIKLKLNGGIKKTDVIFFAAAFGRSCAYVAYSPVACCSDIPSAGN